MKSFDPQEALAVSVLRAGQHFPLNSIGLFTVTHSHVRLSHCSIRSATVQELVQVKTLIQEVRKHPWERMLWREEPYRNQSQDKWLSISLIYFLQHQEELRLMH